MSEFPRVSGDDSGMAKVAGAVVGATKGFLDPLKDYFNDKAKSETEQKNKNLSAAQQSSGGGESASHFEMVSKLLQQSAGHDLDLTRERSRQARLSSAHYVRQMNKIPAKPGTKSAMSFDKEGAVSGSWTQASPARKAAAKGKTAAGKAPMPKLGATANPAKKAGAKKVSPANPSRGGKK